MTIHKTAVVEDGARVHEDAQIGPYVVIGPNVEIGSGTVIGAHAVIAGHTKIGNDCRIYAGASIGLPPQDLKYKDEPTGVIIGNNVHIREYVTIHSATTEGFTVLGDDCFLMTYAHVAHDCKLGKGVILANSTCLAGHVKVGDYVVMSGYCIFHQNVRVGRMAMIGGMTGTRVDLPPFSLCDGRPASVRGINVVGLRRHKIDKDVRAAIKQAYKLIYRSDLNISQALARIAEEIEPYAEIKEIADFFKSTKRGIAVFFDTKREGTVMDEVPMEVI